MYNLTGLGKSLKLLSIEKVFQKAVKRIDSTDNNSAVFFHTNLINTFRPYSG